MSVFKMIISIVPHDKGESLTKAAMNSGCTGGTVLMGRSLANSNFGAILGIGESTKDLIYMVVDSDKKNQIVEAIINSSKNEKKGFGQLFTLDIENLIKAGEEAAKERIFSLLPEDQKAELTAIFDEFEAYETPEAKFAHAIDNFQPLILNNSNGGSDWLEHGVKAETVYGRQNLTRLGSEKIFEVTDKILKKHIEKGVL